MAVRIFITGGTFDKEYDEINGKLFFKTRLIFIESAANVVTPTLTGRISYFFSDLFSRSKASRWR